MILIFRKKNKINETIKDILSIVKNHSEKNFYKIKSNYDNITKEDAYIICSYTIESQNHQFSPYKMLNECFTGDDLLSALKNVSKYLYIFLMT